jgi:hypothetical protein
MSGLIFDIIRLCKSIIGIIILLKAIELFNRGYVSNGLIFAINTFTTESPELITFVFLIMIGVRLIK